MDELYKNLVKLKPKDNVPFKCIGCGECCKHVKEQVPVETLDAFRITRYLMEQDESITCMDDFWERYAEPALLDECGYFVYFLKTKGPDDACIFLENNRCKIHAVNPRACRTYPFIAGPLENGGYEYLISYERKQHFNGPKVHTKTWMKKRFTHEDQAFLSVDFSNAREIAQLLRRVPEENKVRALLCFQRLKYGDLAMEEAKQFAGDTEIAVRAVQAGNDLLCCTEFQTQIPAVIDAVKAGTISEERIDESVERILKLKIELGIIEA